MRVSRDLPYNVVPGHRLPCGDGEVTGDTQLPYVLPVLVAQVAERGSWDQPLLSSVLWTLQSLLGPSLPRGNQPAVSTPGRLS